MTSRFLLLMELLHWHSQKHGVKWFHSNKHPKTLIYQSTVTFAYFPRIDLREKDQDPRWEESSVYNPVKPIRPKNR